MKNRNMLLRSISISIFLICFLVFPLQGQEAKIEKKDGLTIVYNPKNPVQKSGSILNLVLVEDLRIGENFEDENYMFSNIGGVMADIDEDIIVVDDKEMIIKVFDETGNFLRVFGTRGQGPGEFQSAGRIMLKGGKDILVLDRGNGRFSYYSKEGKCLKETLLGKYTSTSRVKPDSRGYLYADTMNFDGDKLIDEVMKFDPEFNKIETIARAERILKYPEINPISVWFMYAVFPNDHFIWGRNTDYEFNIMDPEGKLVKKIIKDYEPVKITQVIQERLVAERYGERGVPENIKLVFPKNFTPWYYFFPDDVGGFYVRTFEENKKGEFKWDVFDDEGIYILSFFLPSEEVMYCVRNNKAYSFINDNDEGIPVVLRYKMEWR